MKSSLLIGTIVHIRKALIDRRFDFKFPWWILRFSELDELEKNIRGFSSKKTSLYSLNTNDHIDLKNFLETTTFFDEGEEIKDIILITNPRCLGYVFNPVSFYLIEGKLKLHAVIEIGNTFSELKPYYVSPQYFSGKSFTFKTPKEFYISPFLSIKNTLEFKLSWTDNKVQIHINDYSAEGILEFTTHYNGNYEKMLPLSNLKIFFQFPLHTVFIITLIHWHAMVLWLKKIPWFSKQYLIDDQKGVWKWKHQKYLPINPLKK